MDSFNARPDVDAHGHDNRAADLSDGSRRSTTSAGGPGGPGGGQRVSAALSQRNTTTQFSETVLNIVIDNEQTGAKKGGKAAKPSKVDFSKLLGPIYAILLVLIGIMFPMSEALNGDWLNTVYNMIYIIYTLSIATLLIFYFEWYIATQKKRSHGKGHRHHHDDSTSSTSSGGSSKGSTASSAAVSRRNSRDFDTAVVTRTSDGGFLIRDAAKEAEKAKEAGKLRRRRRKKISSAADEVTVRKESSMATGGAAAGIRRSASTASTNGISAMVRVHSMSVLSQAPVPDTPTDHGQTASHQEDPYHRRSTAVRRPPTDTTSTDQSDTDFLDFPSDDDDDQRADDVETHQDIWIDLSKLGNVFSHEGSSLYLRLGLLIFAIGNLVYIGLQIESYFNPETSHCSGQFSWSYLVRLVFIVCQTFFVFKNSAIKVHRQEAIVRFGLMHMVATNMSVWLRTLINEIMNEYNHKQHINVSAGCEDVSARHLSTSAYLFPFVLEYSLIAVGMLAVMYSTIDTDEHGHALRGIQNLFRIQALEKSACNEKTADGKHGADHEEGHGMIALVKSHRGLFCGILVLAGCCVSILMFYFNMADQTIIYLSTDIVLSSLMLIATVIALFHLHRLSYIARPASVDDILLLISMSGCVLFEISIMMASGHYIDTQDQSAAAHSSGSTAETTTVTKEALRLSSSMLAAIQSVLQVMLTMMGLRRYPSKQRHLADMPGRGTVTFLIITNVTVWIVRTSLAKELSPIAQEDYYGTLTWLLLLNINLPLLLFFRFHSSVCLADVWHSAYTSPVEPPPPSAAGGAGADGAPSGDGGAGGVGTLGGQAAVGVSTLMRSYSLSHLQPAPMPLPYRPSQASLHHFPTIDDVEVVDSD